MRNIPERVDPNDPNAPWNDNTPGPNMFCPHCQWGYVTYAHEGDDPRGEEVVINDLCKVMIEYCRNCGNAMEAWLRDLRPQYFDAWRNEPEMMAENTVEESFTELKEYGRTADEPPA